MVFAKELPQLAQSVMAQYKEADRLTYFDNIRHYALAAEQYELSIVYLDSTRRLMKPGETMTQKAIGIQWETYARTKMRQKTEQGSFASLFHTAFSDAYNQLNNDAKATSMAYTEADVPELLKKLDTLKIKLGKQDSLSLNDARQLIAAYNAYQVYSQTAAIMKKQTTAADEKEYMIRKEEIRMRDGSTVQVVVVQRRALAAKLPVVFLFNIYAGESFDLGLAKRYANRGFAGVVANTRGKGISKQKIEPFEHDAKDAYDIIDWISKQKWNNGKVGMVGGSYLGFAQWAAAKTVHPALKTIMPQVAVGIGIDYPMTGNIFMNYMLRWIHYVTNNKGRDDTEFFDGERWQALDRKWYREGAAFRSLDTLDGRPNIIFQRWLQHPAFDNYWQDMVTCGADFAKIKIPVLTTTGYFDDDQLGALYYFREHYRHNPAAEHYLVIGPYSHSGGQRYPEATVGNYTVDTAARSFNFVDLSVQWFNYVLNDSTKPAMLKDKINYEVMGANTWKHAASLNAISNNKLRFYFGNTRLNEYYKLESTGNGQEYTRQQVNLAIRSDTLGRGYEIIDSILPVNNVLSFISAPLDEPLQINGAFTAQLLLAINKKDVDIRMRLYELMPDGKYFELSTALQRASYALDRSKRQLLQPGTKALIPIHESFMTSRQLKKGSRIVVVLGVNKTQDWQINYGTGKDVSDETIEDAKEPMDIKWFTDSYIDIPVWK